MWTEVLPNSNKGVHKWQSIKLKHHKVNHPSRKSIMNLHIHIQQKRERETERQRDRGFDWAKKYRTLERFFPRTENHLYLVVSYFKSSKPPPPPIPSISILYKLLRLYEYFFLFKKKRMKLLGKIIIINCSTFTFLTYLFIDHIFLKSQNVFKKSHCLSNYLLKNLNGKHYPK